MAPFVKNDIPCHARSEKRDTKRDFQDRLFYSMVSIITEFILLPSPASSWSLKGHYPDNAHA